jgi:hypothetical protein
MLESQQRSRFLQSCFDISSAMKNALRLRFGFRHRKRSAASLRLRYNTVESGRAASWLPTRSQFKQFHAGPKTARESSPVVVADKKRGIYRLVGCARILTPLTLVFRGSYGSFEFSSSALLSGKHPRILLAMMNRTLLILALLMSFSSTFGQTKQLPEH